jgi:type IV secretory pathway protease TraF
MAEISMETGKNYLKFFCCISLTFIFFYIVNFPITPSIDKHVLLRDVFTNKPIALKDYVRFSLDHELIGGRHDVFKIVGCLEGQLLERKNNGFFCDGINVVKLRPARENGDALPQFLFSGLIPKNKLFVYGTHEYSFGSRHVGFVDSNNAQRMIPLI